ncbi:MAG: transglycosylase domain-containing protein [Myxococcaceae bacterium]|nr:transglycosylase domain-containing protein [Myxococcaceae bacterium]
MWFVPWVGLLKLGFVLYRPYESNGQDRYWRMTGPMFSTWTPEDRIPKSCKHALILQEDQNFYKHPGFDLQNIQQALEHNRKIDHVVLGASTLTQQLVKNLFLSREKSYLRKARELIGAILLDRMVSKPDQLTWYFNVVEFGPRIYGIQDASRTYFHKSPAQLSTADCKALVSLLPAPVQRSQKL